MEFASAGASSCQMLCGGKLRRCQLDELHSARPEPVGKLNWLWLGRSVIPFLKDFLKTLHGIESERIDYRVRLFGHLTNYLQEVPIFCRSLPGCTSPALLVCVLVAVFYAHVLLLLLLLLLLRGLWYVALLFTAGSITRADVDAAMSWNVLKDKHTMEAVKVNHATMCCVVLSFTYSSMKYFTLLWIFFFRSFFLSCYSTCQAPLSLILSKQAAPSILQHFYCGPVYLLL